MCYTYKLYDKILFTLIFVYIHLEKLCNTYNFSILNIRKLYHIIKFKFQYENITFITHRIKKYYLTKI